MKIKVLALSAIVACLMMPVLPEAQQVVPRQQASEQPEIVGFYECQGTNPDGTEYKGLVEIISVRGTFRVHWTLDNTEVWGVGVYRNGVFAVSYFGGAPAIVVYKIEDNGNRIVGEWTMGGRAEGRVYPEVLTKTDRRPDSDPELQKPAPPQPPPGLRV